MDTIDNRKKLGELGGIDDLLQLLATYKRKDPKDPDEIEMMENLFDGLCSALAEKENKRLFLEGEGMELMVIMIKEKKMARIRAVKVLDYAMSTKAGTANCLRFVEIMGLKTLFSIFSRKVRGFVISQRSVLFSFISHVTLLTFFFSFCS